MNYYDPNDRSSRWWAAAAAAAYALLLGLSLALVSFDFSPTPETLGEMIEIEILEPEPQPKPPVQSVTEPQMHERPDRVEQTAQVSGRDETTQTPNPKALFKMSKGGVDEPDNAGNPRAPQGEDKAKGTGPGLSPDGLDQLDKGLQGRGLVGTLPRPTYPGQRSGKVIISVTVGPDGRVKTAEFQQLGSTVNDATLVEAARAAALKARFTENSAPVQGGTITYIFRME